MAKELRTTLTIKINKMCRITDLFIKNDSAKLIELLKEIRAEIENRTFDNSQGNREAGYVGGEVLPKSTWNKLNQILNNS